MVHCKREEKASVPARCANYRVSIVPRYLGAFDVQHSQKFLLIINVVGQSENSFTIRFFVRSESN